MFTCRTIEQKEREKKTAEAIISLLVTMAVRERCPKKDEATSVSFFGKKVLTFETVGFVDREAHN